MMDSLAASPETSPAGLPLYLQILIPILTLVLGFWLKSVFSRRDFAYQTHRQKQIRALEDLYDQLFSFHQDISAAWEAGKGQENIAPEIVSLKGRMKEIEMFFRRHRIHFSKRLNNKLSGYFKAMEPLMTTVSFISIVTPVNADTGEVDQGVKDQGEKIAQHLIKESTPSLLRAIEKSVRKNIR